jgi:hypothetical protein
MVAFAPVCEAPPFASIVRHPDLLAWSALTPAQEAAFATPVVRSVKLLDLLTNRYHAGIVRASSDVGMELELPLGSHLRAGQRVRFVVADERPLVSRDQMRGAFITHIDCEPNRLRVKLALLAEAAAA